MNVRELPILFSGPMVRAILEGRKTVTRRLLKPQPPSVEDVVRRCGSDYGIFTDARQEPTFRVSGPVWAVRELLGSEPHWVSPYGVPGDRLWVRETHRLYEQPYAPHDLGIVYRADDSIRLIDHGRDAQRWESLRRPGLDLEEETWRPSIHMPRWASRLTLEVVSVRVERLHEITTDEARAEGMETEEFLDREEWEHSVAPSGIHCTFTTLRSEFARAWDEINGKRATWESNPWVFRVEFKVVANA